jgi:peptidoglycan hydrolase CwlO-like protein
MKVFFSPIIPIVLAASLAIVSCDHKREEFDGLQKEVEAMKSQLTASDLDMKTQINTLRFVLESYQDDVVPQLVALNEQMKADYEVLAAADILFAQQVEEAQAALQPFISKNAEDIAVNKKAIEAAVAGYKKLVADAIKGYEAAIAKAREDQAFVDGVQDEFLATLASQMDTYKEAIDEAVAALSGAIDDLAAAMEETQGSIEDLAAAMKELNEKVDASFAAAIAYTDALEATVKATTDALAERIAANEAAIKKLNEETIPEIGDAIDALEASMVGLEGNLEALEEKKLDQDVFQAFLTTFIEWMGKVETDIASFNGTLEQLQQFETVLDNEIKEISALVDVLNGDESVKGSVKQQIKALHEDIIEHLNELKGEIEGEIQDLEDELAGIQEDLEAINADIVVIKGQIQDNATEIGKLNVRITNNEGDIAALKTAKTNLENKIAVLNELLEQKEEEIKALLPAIEEKIALINGDKDTEGSIAYAVDQLDQAIQTQIGLISGRIDKTDAEIAELQKEIGKLQQYIQSLVFVPQYQDLKFGIPFTKIDDVYKDYNVNPGFTVVYKVSPAYLAQPLAKAVNDAIAAGVALPFTFDIDSNLQTRAADTDPQLIIKDAIGDEGTGKITFFLSHNNFDPAGDNLDKYAISLRADNSDYNVHVASEYVQAKLHLISSLSVVKDKIYMPDVTTREVDLASVIDCDSDQATDEKTLNVQYIDGTAYAPFEGYEMAAKDEKGVIRTYSQWKALGFDMPDVTVTLTKLSGKIQNLLVTPSGASSTFAVKIKDGDKDNLYNAKYDVFENRGGDRYNFAFADGKNTFNAQYGVNILRYNGDFHIKIVSTFTWTYKKDAEVDHENKGKVDPSTWTSSYVRKRGSEALPWTYEPGDFVAKAYLVIGDEEFQIDGSNKALGLEVSNLEGRDFTPAEPLPYGSNFNLLYYYDDNMIAVEKFGLKGRMGKTYEFTGTYQNEHNSLNNCFNTGDIIGTVVINTVDRKTEDIEITAPERVVKLLGDEYKSGDDFYDIGSASFTDALMAAYVKQGIFDSDYTRKDALKGEFASTNMKYTDATEMSDKFVVIPYAPDSTFIIKSHAGAKSFKSSDLHKVAVNYENKPWALTVETYVGQKVKIHWPIRVAPKYDYRFVTNGSDTFQVPIEWVGGTSAITKAKTELELIRKDDASIKVMYKDGTVEKEVAYGDYGDSDIKLIPRFKLVNATPGVDVDSTIVSGLPCASNVTYYSQTPSVGIKSALYVKSGNTEFYVPGSDKMYVGETPVTSVNVKPSNPIAATQVNPVNPTTIVAGEGLVELALQDVLGNKLYDLGHIQDNVGSYKDKIKKIFNSVKFSVYTVNGSSATAGWSIQGANSFGISDTPDEVKLITNGVATGSYTVVLKASTTWKDYYYTVKVNVQ